MHDTSERSADWLELHTAPLGDYGPRITRIHDNGTLYAGGPKFQEAAPLPAASLIGSWKTTNS